jgi:predicted membrane GTPase involved in stress response
MYPDMPIEQLVRRKGVALQFAFATEAKELLPQHEEFLLDASHKGLRVLAKNEEGLTAPVALLREAYGTSLEVAPPKVRLIEGVQVKEPIMHVRISMYADFREVVKRALQRRGATLSEEYVRSTYCVQRFEAPLAALLGLSAELSQLTFCAAKHWVALSHYAIVTRDPGGKAA